LALSSEKSQKILSILFVGIVVGSLIGYTYASSLFIDSSVSVATLNTQLVDVTISGLNDTPKITFIFNITTNSSVSIPIIDTHRLLITLNNHRLAYTGSIHTKDIKIYPHKINQLKVSEYVTSPDDIAIVVEANSTNSWYWLYTLDLWVLPPYSDKDTLMHVYGYFVGVTMSF